MSLIAMAKPGVRWVDVVKEKFGEDVLKSLKKRWEEALQSGRVDRQQLAYFCRLEPTGLEPATVDAEMEELLAKMLICTPTTWFQIITGHPCPTDAKEEDVGVAFDASSRLRRAGVEYFHDRLVEQNTSKETSLLYLDSLQVPPKVQTLTTVPAKKATALRVVAISDTHLLHENLQLPEGDLLIHGGDLSYEESRSKDAREFEEKLKHFSDFQGFLRWFDSSSLGLKSALLWLGSESKFQHRLLVGGNHDFILEQLGNERAQQLCHHFGVKYLYPTDNPMVLKFESGRTLRVWGSSVSFTSTIGQDRAVQSGNVAFQLDKGAEPRFLEDTAHLIPGSLDVMVTHSPPCGLLLGKANDPPWINNLVRRIKPKLYLCGHCHNPLPEKLNLGSKVAEVEGVVGANVACTSVWNSFSGSPLIVDVDSSPTGTTAPDGSRGCSLREGYPRSSQLRIWHRIGTLMGGDHPPGADLEAAVHGPGAPGPGRPGPPPCSWKIEPGDLC
eukprot:s2242_g6.t1